MPRAQSSGSELIWHLAAGPDLVALQAEARRFLDSLGFSRTRSAEVLIAASEMATNSLKHAGGGTLSLFAEASPVPGVRVEANDGGPGFERLEQALQDHVSEGRNLLEDEDASRRRRGLGTGLGAIRRLMDRFDVYSEPGRGARVVAFKQRI